MSQTSLSHCESADLHMLYVVFSTDYALSEEKEFLKDSQHVFQCIWKVCFSLKIASFEGEADGGDRADDFLAL